MGVARLLARAAACRLDIASTVPERYSRSLGEQVAVGRRDDKIHLPNRCFIAANLIGQVPDRLCAWRAEQ